MRTPLLVVFTMALACGAAAGAGAKEFVYTDTTPAGMKVELVSGHYGLEREFCHALRYRVTNPTAEPREFTLEVFGTWRTHRLSESEKPTCSISQTGIVPAQTNVIVTIQPFAGAFGNSCNVFYGKFPRLTDASGASSGPDFASYGEVSQLYSGRENVCLASPDYDAGGKACQWLSIRYVGESVDPCGKVSVDWSDFTHWSDFAVFTGVLLTDKAWQRVPGEVREMLADYEAAGGLVIRDGSLPSKSRLRLIGEGGTKVGSPLPGAVALVDELKNHRVPLPLMLVVMFAFALVAGPVLLTVLARRNRRIAILWVFPVVALAFTAVLTVAVRIAVGNRPVRETFEKVETVGDREVRRTSVVWFSPTRVHETIAFPEDVFVRFAPDSSHDLPRHYANGGRTLDLHQIPPLWPVRFDTIEVLRK